MSMDQTIIIGGVTVGGNNPPFMVAEMSGNHNQSLGRALAIVEAAAGAGVHAIKLQTYTADTMTIDCESEGFVIDYPESLWHGESLYGLYEKAHTPWDWHRPIMDRCRELGILCFSTPFDGTAVDFLEELDVPAYKIASFENTDLPLIKKVAATGKPVIISTGMASLVEIDEAVDAARSAGCNDIILLKCTSSYPATPIDSNLATIPDMRERYNVQVGLSDHTLGIGAALAGVALGAIFIEKHFTLDRKDGGVDAVFSMEPSEMASLVVEVERAWQAVGRVHYGSCQREEESLKYRRSLFIVEDMKEGQILSPKNMRSIRPGFGLSPKHELSLLGRPVNRDIKKGTPLSWDMVG